MSRNSSVSIVIRLQDGTPAISCQMQDRGKYWVHHLHQPVGIKNNADDTCSLDVPTLRKRGAQSPVRQTSPWRGAQFCTGRATVSCSSALSVYTVFHLVLSVHTDSFPTLQVAKQPVSELLTEVSVVTSLLQGLFQDGILNYATRTSFHALYRSLFSRIRCHKLYLLTSYSNKRQNKYAYKVQDEIHKTPKQTFIYYVL